MYINQLLKDRREELQISLRELSKLTGISKSALQKYESTDFDITLTNFIKLCTALKLDPNKTLDSIIIKEIEGMDEAQLQDILNEIEKIKKQ